MNVITCVFNPRRFHSRYRLYNQFAEYLKQLGITLITVEVAFGKRPFMVTHDHKHHVQLRTHTELWHKERALNIGLQRLTQVNSNWEYVAWMDCDVKLARPDWDSETVDLLQHYSVLQMFSQARQLNPEHHMLWSCKSIIQQFIDNGTIGKPRGNPGVNSGWHGHPGLAWAFRREELERIGGWLDICINGSGDLHMAACYTGDYTIALSNNVHLQYAEALHKYGLLCNRYIHKNVGLMPGAIDHYWHGKSRERGYDHRWKILDKYKFNPNTDLILDLNGLYKWNFSTPRVIRLAAEIRRSLSKRNEDSIDE